jgi:4-hydroxy-2-oxoglutarate aldolase
VAILSQHPNIVGMKETNSDMVQFAEHLTRTKAGFIVLAGAASTYYSALALGAHGAILAVAGVAPDLVVEIHQLALKGRYVEARQLQRRLAPLAKSVGTQWGVPGLKAALDLIGLAGGVPRPPLQAVNAAAIDVLRGQLKDLALLPVTA